MAIGTYISTITLNVNGLNAPTKRHRLAEWIKKKKQKQKNKTYIYAETHFRSSNKYRPSEQIEKDIPCT